MSLMVKVINWLSTGLIQSNIVNKTTLFLYMLLSSSDLMCYGLAGFHLENCPRGIGGIWILGGGGGEGGGAGWLGM